MNFGYRNSGFTLVTGLVFLVLLTMVGTTAIQTSAVQEKSTGNVFDKARSFQAAESGLGIGEAWVNAQSSEPIVASACVQPCVSPLSNALFFEDLDQAWWAANSAQVGAGTINGVYAQPYYYLEHVAFVPDDATIGSGLPKGVNYYQVSSMGIGGTSTANTVVTSTYSKRF